MPGVATIPLQIGIEKKISKSENIWLIQCRKQKKSLKIHQHQCLLIPRVSVRVGTTSAIAPANFQKYQIAPANFEGVQAKKMI